MKNRPIHENLDTSFVNLPALVKYLRRRQFAGSVRIELSGYEADIYLTAENQLSVREYDHVAGRIAEGEEALRRIFIRSREPGGIINVYQAVAEPAAEKKSPEAFVEPPPPKKPPAAAKPTVNGKPNQRSFAGGQAPNDAAAPPKVREKPRPPKPILPKLPFELTNKVETRAKQPALSAEDRATLLNLTGELLGTIDRALAAAKLEFPAAFQKACAEIAVDYPFLATLDYRHGKISYADADAHPKIFVAGVLEALRRILDKLAQNDKFPEVHRSTTQRVLTLIDQRRALYDRFSMTRPLERVLGA